VEHTRGRHSGSFRYSGYYLYRIPGAGTSSGRRSSYLSIDNSHVVSPLRENSAWLLVFRLLDDVHNFRRWNGSVLGEITGAGIPELRTEPSAARRNAATRPGCYRSRLGVYVQLDLGSARHAAASFDTGLVSAIRVDGSLWCF